jgi:hypothetical protein
MCMFHLEKRSPLVITHALFRTEVQADTV